MSLSSELSALLERVANGQLSLEQFEEERTRVLDALWDRPRIDSPHDVADAVTEQLPAPPLGGGPARPRPAIRVIVDSPEDTYDWVEQDILPGAEEAVREQAGDQLALRWSSPPAPSDEVPPVVAEQQTAAFPSLAPSLDEDGPPATEASLRWADLLEPGDLGSDSEWVEPEELTSAPQILDEDDVPTETLPLPSETTPAARQEDWSPVSFRGPLPAERPHESGAAQRTTWTWGQGGFTFLPGLLLIASGIFGLLQPLPEGASDASMQFESSRFVLFFLGVLSTYWFLKPWRQAQKAFLVGASFFFYSTYSLRFVTVLAAAILGNYFIGQRIHGSPEKTSKFWLKIGVGANLLLLGVFKYYGFFVESLGDVFALLGFEAHLPVLQILLPVGISFYTFQSIAYLVELRRPTAYPAKSLLDFALFLGFFPQLLIGPICRGRELLPQIEAPAPDRLERVSEALSLILGGLFKRMVLGSLLFTYGVSEIFYTPENYSSAALWVAMVAYTVQIWCDFSGYTDIVRGCALLLGFDIPDNFAGPYVATSVGDFWRRWHITFSNWLRDFIYFPLGGSHCPRPRTYFNLFMTMFVCGLWHGATWGFVLWGGIHGLALVHYKWSLDRARDRGLDPRKTPKPALVALRGWLWTMGIVCFSRIFFVASDLGSALLYIERMFSPSLPGLGFETILIPITIFGIWLNFSGASIRERYVAFCDQLSLRPRFVLWLITFLVVTSLRPAGVLPNAYFQF